MPEYVTKKKNRFSVAICLDQVLRKLLFKVSNIILSRMQFFLTQNDTFPCRTFPYVFKQIYY